MDGYMDIACSDCLRGQLIDYLRGQSIWTVYVDSLLLQRQEALRTHRTAYSSLALHSLVYLVGAFNPSSEVVEYPPSYSRVSAIRCHTRRLHTKSISETHVPDPTRQAELTQQAGLSEIS